MSEIADALVKVLMAAASLIAAIASAWAAIRATQAHTAANQAKVDIAKVEMATNSMKDALIASTEKEAHARGIKEGTQTEKDRAKPERQY